MPCGLTVSSPPRLQSPQLSAKLGTGRPRVGTMNKFSCLYYPFSRCVEPAALKQILLVFDHVTFLDPVTDDEWRAHLLEDESHKQGGTFQGHRELHESLETLKRQGAIRLVDPARIPDATGEAAAASALSDLMDPRWAAMASEPGKFGLPARKAADGRATWQIFSPKLPPRFVDALRQRGLRSHLLADGGDDTAWTLSYEAGSAAALNAHIAAAEALSLAPVTDSALHHALYLRKLARMRSADGEALPTQALEGRLALTLLGELLPKQALETLTFEQILEFRDETREARQALIRALQRKLVSNSSSEFAEMERASAGIIDSLAAEVREYAARMSEVRTRLFASLVPAVSKSALPSGLFAVGLAYAGVGAGQVLAGSIAATALAAIHSTLELKAERDRLAMSTAPAIAYLSRIVELVSRS